MSRSASKSHYITPIDTTGAPLPTTKQAGAFTLTAGTKYYYIVSCAGSPWTSVTMSGSTSGIVITSATIQDTDHPIGGVGNGGAGGVADNSDATNSTPTGFIGWVPEGNSSSAVAVTGTGWSTTNGVVSALGTGFGAARFNIEGTGAYRTRLEVVVGATGGDLTVSCYEKA